MWYILKTQKGTEETLEKTLKSLPYVSSTYLPHYRRLISGESKNKRYKYLLTLPSIVFVNVTKANLSKFYKRLTISGYLRNGDNKDYEGHPHLIQLPRSNFNKEEFLELSRVPAKDFNIFKIYNDQRDIEKNMENLDIVDDVSFKQLEQTHDLVYILDGPFSKYTGIVKRESNIVDGKKKGRDNRLYCRVGNLSVRISNIRKYNYIIIREALHGQNFPLTNTWRFMDRLIGKLQTTFFPDEAPRALRLLLTLMNQHTLSQMIHETRKRSLDTTDAQDKKLLAFISVFLEEMDNNTRAALIILSHYFQTVNELKEQSLENIIPDAPLRPMMTPTSGKKFPKGARYVTVEHHDFLELILCINLRKQFSVSKRPHLSDNDYTYYIHIGVKQKNDSCITVFVNWSGFIHSFMMMDEKEQTVLLQNFSERNVQSMAQLLQDPESLYDADENLAGFKEDVSNVNAGEVLSSLRQHSGAAHLPYLAAKHCQPLVDLLKRCITSAVDLWQSPRFSTQRKQLQRYVLLHKIPVKDEEVVEQEISSLI